MPPRIPTKPGLRLEFARRSRMSTGSAEVLMHEPGRVFVAQPAMDNP